MKKILIFSTAYVPFIGGAEVAVREITQRIPDMTFDLITARMKRNLPREEPIGTIQVYRVGFGIAQLDKLLLPFWGSIVALRLIKKNRYNVFWAVMVSFASGAAYIANNLFLKKKIPIVLTLQEGDSEKYFRKKWFGIINIAWRRALAKTSSVTAISTYLGNRARMFGYTGPVTIIPNGVDVELFSRGISLEERKNIREALGIKESEIALITASRLVVKNGLGDVIKALSFLPPHIKFIICGTGELEGALRRSAKNLGVEDRVIFKGFVKYTDLPSYLHASDVFIRPSLSEGMGNSFVEAMAVGVPIIGTMVGGITDFLKDKETGFVCGVRDPKSIAEQVMFITQPENADVIARVVKNAHALVKENYDWNKISRDMKSIFDRLP